MIEGPNRKIKMRGNMWSKFPYKVYKLSEAETEMFLSPRVSAALKVLWIKTSTTL